MMGAEGKSPVVWRGVGVALVLSAAFVGLVVLVSPLVAALVVVPVALASGAVMGRRRSLATPHCLSPTHFDDDVQVAAPKAADAPGRGTTSAA